MTRMQSFSLILLPFCFLILIIFLVYPNSIWLKAIFTTCENENYPSTTSLTNFVGPFVVKPNFRLLISVFTTAGTFERRHLIRHVYSLWPNSTTRHINLRFVLCNITSEEHAMMVSLETKLHNDIIILNCTENINEGKTYNFFSSLPGVFGHDRPYDYVMKTDDDTYIRLDKLIESLKDKPRNDMYYGLEIPCNGTEFNFWIPTPFMTGLGYLLSWDLVEWISSSDIPLNHTIGSEDMMLGWWLQMGEKGNNKYNNAQTIYDFRGHDQETNCFRHDLIDETIAVHQLKENSRWVTVFKFFNVTDRLNRSILRHTP